MNDENEFLGIPDMSMRETEKIKKNIEADKKADSSESIGLREGDSGIGQPEQSPLNIFELTDEEKEKLRISELDDKEQLETLKDINLSISIPTFIFNKTILLVAVTLGSAVLLYVATQVLFLLKEISDYPPWVQYLWYSGLSIFGVLSAYTLTRLIIAYSRLKKSPQIQISGAKQIKKRSRLRELSITDNKAAKNAMIEYLTEYPIESEKFVKKLNTMGFSEADIALLQKKKQQLLDKERTPSAEEWLRIYKTGFQSILDNNIEKRIKSYALRVGLKTAATPNSTVDMLIVFYFNFTLINDLCSIYNLRMSSTATALILIKVFINIYLAGRIEQAADTAADIVFEGTNILTRAASKAIPKLAECKANGVLTWRLGKSTASFLSPVA
jgi:uncharacterized membrane protein YcjF (UPF0283 family)